MKLKALLKRRRPTTRTKMALANLKKIKSGLILAAEAGIRITDENGKFILVRK